MDPPRSDAAPKDPSRGGQRVGSAGAILTWRFLSAASAETTAAFGVACLVLIAFGVVTGVALLVCAAEFSAPPRMLTSEFVALHIAAAFRWPSYLVVVYCGGLIAHRDGGAKNLLVASKAASLCALVFCMLTAFGIAALVAQITRGQPALDLPLIAYALYIDFGWHLFVLGLVSVGIQVTLRDAVRRSLAADASPMTEVFRGGWFGMSVVAAVFLAAWALGGGQVPFGPQPVPYSGMNGYGHDLDRFFASGIYWTAFAVILVLATHARTCRDEGSRRLAPGVVNAGTPAIVIWAASGCWIYYGGDPSDPNADAEHERRYERQAQPGVLQVVAMDLSVDIFPVERRLRSGGSMLLANTGAESMGELVLLFPRGARVGEIDIPNTSMVEESEESGVRRYAFARPLRFGERVRMRFEMAWQQGGFGGRPNRLIENGTFIESSDVVPSFGHERVRAGEEAPATRIRAVIGTSLDQVVVGPGILLREWKENARRYFEYARSSRAAAHAPRSEAPGSVWPPFAIQSARYAVARDHWNGSTVEVYHHPDHHRNVGSIFRCVRQSLGRLAPSSSPYPDGLLRVVEFPYAGETQEFPDAILFSERGEFTFDSRGGRRIDALCASVAGAVARQRGVRS